MNTLTMAAPRPAARRDASAAAAALVPARAGTLPTLWALTGFSIALLLGFAAAGALDARTLDGSNVWLKPAKFALSFVVLCATLALVAERMSAAVRDGRLMRIVLAVMTVATAGEMAYIAGQAGRGVHSHFSVQTPFTALMYTLMGIGAVALVLGIGIIGVLAWRDRAARLGPALRLGVGLGFVLSALLTVVIAGYLGGNGSHFVGTPSPGATTVPGLGWSLEVGDLRPAHFLALHAMQLLPLLGLWLDRGGNPAARRWVWAAAAAYAGLTVAVFVQALMGLPLLPTSSAMPHP
jgi:hypothetical protein